MKFYGDLTWKQVTQSLDHRILFIPCGSLEQHGPHLPLNVDTVITEEIAKRIASTCGGIVAPAINYGARSLPGGGGGYGFPGNIHIRGELLIEIYYDIIHSFLKNGARRLVIINGHWENYSFLIEAIEKLREENKLEGKKLCSLSWWDVVNSEEMIGIFGEFFGWHTEHAGQAETALMMYYHSEKVLLNERVDTDHIHPENIYGYPIPEDWSSENGNLCNTTHVTYQMGEQLAKVIEARLNELVEKLMKE